MKPATTLPASLPHHNLDSILLNHLRSGLGYLGLANPFLQHHDPSSVFQRQQVFRSHHSSPFDNHRPDSTGGLSTGSVDESLIEEEEEEAQDLSVKRRRTEDGASVPSGYISNGNEPSCVRDIMDKFGFSHVQEYEEAYTKALKESNNGSNNNTTIIGSSSPLNLKQEKENRLHPAAWTLATSPSLTEQQQQQPLPTLLKKDKLNQGKQRRSSTLKDLPLPPGVQLPPMEPSAIKSLVQKGRLDALFDPEQRKELIGKGRNDTCEYCGKVCVFFLLI